MKKEQRQKYYKILNSEKERIEKEIEQLEKENQEAVEAANLAADDNFEDQIGDSASITFERERDFSLLQNKRDLLEQINEALKRWRSGGYGICAACGRPIKAARLEALPYAEYCIECKKNQER